MSNILANKENLTGGEMLSLVECVETAVYIRAILAEVTDCNTIEIKCYIDNKSLVDALHSS